MSNIFIFTGIAVWVVATASLSNAFIVTQNKKQTENVTNFIEKQYTEILSKKVISTSPVGGLSKNSVYSVPVQTSQIVNTVIDVKKDIQLMQKNTPVKVYTRSYEDEDEDEDEEEDEEDDD